MSERRPTIADVAREAGVSASTASVVFSGKTPVSDQTRQRVLAAADALGYLGPDPRAASFRRGRSGIVGVVFEEPLRTAFLDPVKITTMEGLTDAFGEVGAGLLLLRDDAAGVGPAVTAAPIDAAVLIGWSGTRHDTLQNLRARHMPVVVIEGDAGDGIPQITLENRIAQREAASHLRELGHERVAVLTLPLRPGRERGWMLRPEPITIEATRERLAGARDVYPAAPVYAAWTSSIDEGLCAGREILADPDVRPSAVIAQSDLLAAGVIRAAEELGLRVPEDLSVTGFDGIEVDGLDTHRLTTLAQPAIEKGRAAGAAVISLLAGEDAASVTFACPFRPGTTSAPPRPREAPHR